MILTPSLMSSALYFGPFQLHRSQVFYESLLCRGIVNLKPIVHGHVLIIPKRICPRFSDLTEAEVADLFLCVHKIAPRLELHYKCSALNIAIQDGADAGQSVPHVHVHLLPRKIGDFKVSDDVYSALEEQQLDKVFDPSLERTCRTIDQMAAESATLRLLFPDNVPRD